MILHGSHRHDIDGLRAIAVLGVVLYHYGASWLPAALPASTCSSSSVVLSSPQSCAGKSRQAQFSILAFYAGRVRRILPALLVVITFTLLAGWFILAPGDYASLGGSASFASIGIANFFFKSNTGYFDRAAELQPLLHTWSLGVEEQFYLVWPVAVVLSMALVRSIRVHLIC